MKKLLCGVLERGVYAKSCFYSIVKDVASKYVKDKHISSLENYFLILFEIMETEVKG